MEMSLLDMLKIEFLTLNALLSSWLSSFKSKLSSTNNTVNKKTEKKEMCKNQLGGEIYTGEYSPMGNFSTVKNAEKTLMVHISLSVSSTLKLPFTKLDQTLDTILVAELKQSDLTLLISRKDVK